MCKYTELKAENKSFSSGFAYQSSKQTAPLLAKMRIKYDAGGRPTETTHPDGSKNLVVYGTPHSISAPPLGENAGYMFTPSPWLRFAYDQNDLGALTNTDQAYTGAFTPKSELVDALGRTIRTTEHSAQPTATPSVFENVVMHYEYDIQGNLKKVIDALGREAFRYWYDLKQKRDEEDSGANVLKTRHIDKGEQTILFDASFKPIESKDAKGSWVLNAYDKLQRPTQLWGQDNTGESITLRQFFEYGTDINKNLLGKPHKLYDEAGLIVNEEFDFKGNLLKKHRQTLKHSELLSVFDGPPVNWNVQCYRVDWTGLNTSILSTKEFKTQTAYDALNRITLLTYPDDADNIANELVPTYNNAGALEKVIFNNEAYVEHIAYNAKGQRILLALGNQIMTRYTYDTQTFRLLRQRSEKYVRTHLNGIIKYAYDSGTNKQDYHYQYDLVGNILKITDQSPEAGVGGSASLERTFDYDPLYRLLKATGRENAPLEPMPWDDAYRSQDKTLTTAYTQNYAYDKMGNILKLQHIGNNNFTRNFSYQANSNKLDELQFGSTTLNYTYDPCGNLLNEDASRHNEWDYADRMRCFRIQTPNNEPSKYAQYLYDAEGNRVMKLVRNQGGTWSSIIYIDGIFEFLQNSDDEEQSNSFIMDDRSRIAIIRAGDTMGDGSPAVKYNLEDNLGSSMTLLSTDGSWISWEEYYPFGETSLGSYEKKRYRYTGKERDEESGLYYYGARYYAAWTCRFVSVDPLAAKYPNLSGYLYAYNNPIIMNDPTGMEGEESGGSTDNIGGGFTSGLTTAEFNHERDGAVFGGEGATNLLATGNETANVEFVNGGEKKNDIDSSKASFWERSNIRQARIFANQIGGKFEQWKGSDGKRYASVTVNTVVEGTGSVDADSREVTLDQQNVTTYMFKPGQDRSDLLMKSGVGFYKAARASASGWDRVVWALKSGDAWARGWGEYSRGGQAPNILKAIAGLNPIIGGYDAFEMNTSGKNIYGEEVGMGDKIWGVTGIILPVVDKTFGRIYDAINFIKNAAQ